MPLGSGCSVSTTASSAASSSAMAATRSRPRATASCWRSPAPRAAVLFAIGVQRTLDAHGRSQPAELLRVRIGMHTGEAIMEDGDLFGHSVVLAARIAGRARGGEILVSSLVREIVESRGDLAFGETRKAELKGLAGAHQLHPILWAAGNG